MSTTTMRARTASPLPPASPGRKLDCDHEHYNMEVCDEVFNLGVDDMFTMLFTDSPLFNEFIRRRRTYNVRLAPWPDEPDERGEKARTIYYTLSINYAIGPKCSPTTEKQVMYPESRPGERYLIDADCANGGVPYSDHFSTVIRYCMTTVAPGKTRLVISGRVMYHKTVWGVVKGFIEKTAVQGLAESFGVMTNLLRIESNRRLQSETRQTAARPTSLPINQRHHRNASSADPGATSNGRRRRPGKSHRHQATSDCNGSGPSRDDDDDGMDTTSSPTSTGTGSTSYDQYSPSFDDPSSGRFDSIQSKFDMSFLEQRDPAELLVLLLFIVILALVVVNAALYYQVTSLESTLARTLMMRERIAR